MLPKFASYVMCAFSLCIIMYVWGFGFKIECFKLNSVSRNLRYWTPEYLSASHGRLCKHGRFCTKNLIFSVWWKKIRNVMLVNIISVIYVNITLHKIPQFHLISWCGNFVERHSFRIVSGDSPEAVRKLCLSTNFPHQEIRRNCGILCSVILLLDW